MLKNHPYIKRTLIALLSFILLFVVFGFWFFSLIPDRGNLSSLKATKPEQLSYLRSGVKEHRGRILTVVTNVNEIGSSGKWTGYELTELSRAYYVFKTNGFEIDVASPLGGKPPVVIDGNDMGEYDFAFLNDPVAQRKTSESIPMNEVNPEDYQAVYFAGGKGAMFDFPENEYIHSLVRQYSQTGKVIGAVCHGPAALVNVMLDDGRPLLSGRQVSCFTNEEELLLIPDAEEIFPFLLESKLVERGAAFKGGPAYLKQFSYDGNLITGQNPWSVWALAESMVQQLGYTPVEREMTGEENAISILTTYENKGYRRAEAQVASLMSHHESEIDRKLLAMHVMVGAMQWDFAKSLDVVRLLSAAKIK